MNKKKLAAILCAICSLFFVFSPVIVKAETEQSTTQQTTKQTTTQAQNAKLSVTSTPKETTLSGTNKTTITYVVKNTGNVTVTDVTLKDSDIAGSKTIGSVGSLSAGASKTFTYEATFTRNSTSSPVVTCKANGATKTFSGSPVKITLSDEQAAKLSATLSADKQSVSKGEEVKFSLTIKNEGKSAVSSISVTDSTGKKIKEGVSVGGNSSTSIEFSQKIENTTKVKVNLNGKDANSKDVSVSSNEVEVKVDGAAVTANEGLTLTVYSNSTELEKSGEIELTLELQNNMDKAYTDIKIVDKITGQSVQTLPLLSAGQSKEYTSKITVSKTTSFQYEVTATYEDGTNVTIASNTLDVTVGKSGFSGLNIIIVVLVIILLLIIGTSVTLFVLSKKEKKQKKEMAEKYSSKYKKDDVPKKTEEVKKAPPVFSSFTIDDNNAQEDITIPKNNSFDDELEDTKPIEPNDEIVEDQAEKIVDQPSYETKSVEAKKIDYNDLDPDNM